MPMTPTQEELYKMLAEEGAEIVQACTKILRHGPDSHNPYKPGIDNLTHLRKEICDLAAVVEMLYDEGVSLEPLGQEVVETIKQKRHWMHNAPAVTGV